MCLVLDWAQWLHSFRQDYTWSLTSTGLFWLSVWYLLEEILPNTAARHVLSAEKRGKRVSGCLCITVIIFKSATWFVNRVSVKFISSLHHPSAFFKIVTSEGGLTLLWTCREVLGICRGGALSEAGAKAGRGLPGPCPIIQTGHLTPLPSHDYWWPLCRQSSFTEATWGNSGTHLLISRLLFIFLHSWAQSMTWARGKQAGINPLAEYGS